MQMQFIFNRPYLFQIRSQFVLYVYSVGHIMGKCEYCNVVVPDGPQSMEDHESGKKHMRARAAHESTLTLAVRSIFLKWSKATTIDKKELSQVINKFGEVERVICREDSSYAIVEFKEKNAATQALAEGKIVVNGVSVNITERKMNFSPPAAEKVVIDVQEVVKKCHSRQGFSQQIDSVIEDIAIHPDEMEKRSSLAKRLEAELARYFVAPHVRIFGSSITSIGTIDSDIDACLVFGTDPECVLREGMSRDKYTLLTCDASILRGRRVHGSEMLRLTPADRCRFLSKVLNEVRKEVSWLGQQHPVLDGRCPIVRFIADKRKLVDLSVDNLLGCAKSDYLRVLVERDASQNLRRIFLGFRFWAKVNGLFDSVGKDKKGQFNAYMLNLMCVTFLQQAGFLPKYQHSEQPVYDGSWRIDFEVPEFDLTNVILPQLFREMFTYFISVKLQEKVLSPREGAIVEPSVIVDKFQAMNLDLEAFKLSFLNVQDPLELVHNVCQNVSEPSIRLFNRRVMFSIAVIKVNRTAFWPILELQDQSKEPDRSVYSNEGADAICTVPHYAPHLSIEDVAEQMEQIFTQILGFEQVSDPPNKRGRSALESDNQVKNMREVGTFQVYSRLWIGRRNARRTLASEKEKIQNNMQMEKKVSQHLLKNSDPSNAVDLKLRAYIAREDNDTLRIVFRDISNNQNSTDMKDMSHFVEQMVTKFNHLDTNGEEQKNDEEQMDTA